MSKLVFLSHAHKEKELAMLIKTAIEDEFSGFVDVFVSSDEESIIAGSDFFAKIEESLVQCCAGIILVSPESINRNWINFEFGAMWYKNVGKKQEGGVTMPLIPLCHSNLIKDKLPYPISKLTAIQANSHHELTFLFKSLQSSLGGKGELKTDFTQLSRDVLLIERKYTVALHLYRFMNILAKPNGSINQIIKCAEMYISKPVPYGSPKPDDFKRFTINHAGIEQNDFQMLLSYAKNELKEHVEISDIQAFQSFDTTSIQNLVEAKITISSPIVLECKEQILSFMQNEP